MISKVMAKVVSGVSASDSGDESKSSKGEDKCCPNSCPILYLSQIIIACTYGITRDGRPIAGGAGIDEYLDRRVSRISTRDRLF